MSLITGRFSNKCVTERERGYLREGLGGMSLLLCVCVGGKSRCYSCYAGQYIHSHIMRTYFSHGDIEVNCFCSSFTS